LEVLTVVREYLISTLLMFMSVVSSLDSILPVVLFAIFQTVFILLPEFFIF